MYKKNKLNTNHFAVDVEADGQTPLMYNMINFGIVSIADPTKTFLGEVYPIHMNNGGVPEARAVSGVSWEQQLGFRSAKEVMKEAEDFILDISDGRRATLWSDNNQFDGGYMNAYFHYALGRNPFGFSSRRIGCVDSGLRNNIFNTQRWKRLRRAPHDHNPVNDALGNAQAMRVILGVDDKDGNLIE